MYLCTWFVQYCWDDGYAYGDHRAQARDHATGPETAGRPGIWHFPRSVKCAPWQLSFRRTCLCAGSQGLLRRWTVQVAEPCLVGGDKQYLEDLGDSRSPLMNSTSPVGLAAYGSKLWVITTSGAVGRLRYLFLTTVEGTSQVCRVLGCSASPVMQLQRQL